MNCKTVDCCRAPEPYHAVWRLSWLLFKYMGTGFFILFLVIFAVTGGLDLWAIGIGLMVSLFPPVIFTLGFLLKAWSSLRDFDRVSVSPDRVVFSHSYRRGELEVALPEVASVRVNEIWTSGPMTNQVIGGKNGWSLGVWIQGGLYLESNHCSSSSPIQEAAQYLESSGCSVRPGKRRVFLDFPCWLVRWLVRQSFRRMDDQMRQLWFTSSKNRGPD